MELRGDAVTVATTTGFYLRYYDSNNNDNNYNFVNALWEPSVLTGSVRLVAGLARGGGAAGRVHCLCRPIRTHRRAARCSCCRPIRMCLQDVSWPSMDNVQYVQVGGHGCYGHCKRKWGSLDELHFRFVEDETNQGKQKVFQIINFTRDV